MLTKLINIFYSILGLYLHRQTIFKQMNGKPGYYKIQFTAMKVGPRLTNGYAYWRNLDKTVDRWKLFVETYHGDLSFETELQFSLIESIGPWEPLAEDVGI